MEGWIKLYRKSKDNPLMKDANAWMIFTWVLLTVDRATGEMTTGRYFASSHLALNSNTFYKALKRLEKKYKVVTLSSNNRFTTIRVLNWAKYQYTEEVVTQVGNNTVTQPVTQRVTHIQEVEKKELRTISKDIAYGNEDINILIAYMKEKMKLPLLDETVQVNRNYANLAIKKFGGREKVQVLIDVASTHDFWSTRVTSFKTLYYKGVSIISSNRHTKFGVTKI